MNSAQDCIDFSAEKKSLKVLVVDDDAEDIRYLRRLLQRSGCKYELIEANSIEQGLESLQQNPDVILLDYFIGEATGLEFLARLGAAAYQPPVILLTGVDDSELDHCVYSGLVADYLSKSKIEPGILLRSLRYAHRDAIRVRQLEYLAHYDSLTGLCNRRLFMDRFDHAFESAKRYHTTGALLYIDVDGFKKINDDLGHDCGDELLRQVAGRMHGVVRSADTVARLGGDEFVILLENISIAEAHCVAQKLLSSMEQAVSVGSRFINGSLSIGLCAFSAESPSPHHILVNADRALYQAKLIGKHTYCSFNKRLVDSIERQKQLESTVHEAVQSGSFDLLYQPVFLSMPGAAENTFIGVVVSPRFPLLDTTQQNDADIYALIDALGWSEHFFRLLFEKLWVDEVLRRQLAGCNTVIVNLAAFTGRLDGLCCWLLEQMQIRNIDPSGYCVEIPEAFWRDASADTVSSLRDLRQAGCGIVLVDFGGDPGVLRNLAAAPLSAIRLASDWVLQAESESWPRAVLEGVVNILLMLGLEVQVVQVPGISRVLQRVRCIGLGAAVALTKLALECSVQLQNPDPVTPSLRDPDSESGIVHPLPQPVLHKL